MLQENLFDILRNGKRDVTPELMDVVLRALDTVNEQFADLSNGQEPNPAEPELITQLEKLVAGEDISGEAAAPAEEPVEEAPAQAASEGSGDGIDFNGRRI